MNPNLNEAIANFDIISFLEENNIDYKLEGKNIGSEWIGINPCPSCNDSRFHAAIHKDNKNFTCWVCKDNFWLGDFISKIKGSSKKEAVELILEYLPEKDEDLVDNIRNILNSKEQKPISKVKEKAMKIPPSILITPLLIKSYKPLQDFLKARKLTIPDLNEYNIKIGIQGKYKSRLIFPIHYKKQLVAFQTRHLIQKLYLNEGPMGHYLYKPERINTKYPLIIVEGIFDYINIFKFIQRFLKGKMNVTTGFSKKLTNEQIKILNNINISSIIFSLDGDSWHDYYSSNISLHCKTDFLILPKNNDPGNMTEKEMLHLFTKNGIIL
jgi:hypothetical protein